MSAREQLFIIFTDLQNFSDLSDQQVMEFHNLLHTELASRIKPLLNKAKVWNTWGDAVFAAFETGIDAVNFLLTYREYFQGKRIDDIRLKPRIAAHYGNVLVVEDPLKEGQINIFGGDINNTARMEPITRPGEIFVSVEFKDAFEFDSNTQQAAKVRFDPLGYTQLAKGSATFEIFRMCEEHEDKHVLDKLAIEDLTEYIPDIPNATPEEQELLEELLKQTNSDRFVSDIYGKSSIPQQPSMTFLFKIAEHCKKLGAYEQCLDFIEQIERSYLEVEGVPVYPFKHLPKFKKLKANALTRLGNYKQAADIMYGLWHSGAQDVDTLCMLAAQYKRRAVYGKTKTQSAIMGLKKPINKELLNRASKLYLEAFRRDINNYYPAINAAYLYHIINDSTSGRGTKLASYIRQSWKIDQGDNWWLDATLAEAEMLAGDIEDALAEFKHAIAIHQPSKFDLTATYKQIDLYAKLTNKEDPLLSILALLNDAINQS